MTEKEEKKLERNKKWWRERAASTQDNLTKKNVKETNKQLIKYYQQSMNSVISSFEATLDKLIATMEDDRDITPADLYKLDRYWEMQGQLKKELQKLGDKQAELLSKRFTEQYLDIYKAMALQGESFFNVVDAEMAQQMINQIWCADGNTWSQRVWTNMDKLQDALNNGLIECVVTGKKSSELKQKLIKEFGVAYHRADSLVRTEMAHIQTQAAQQRYKEYGVKRVEVLVDVDDRTCPICAKHEGEIISVHEQMPVPFHPRCRCCIVPVIE